MYDLKIFKVPFSTKKVVVGDFDDIEVVLTAIRLRSVNNSHLTSLLLNKIIDGEDISFEEFKFVMSEINHDSNKIIEGADYITKNLNMEL